MDDFRVKSEQARAEGMAGRWPGHALSGLPDDREGLIAVLHPQLVFDADTIKTLRAMAASVAARTQQRVFIVRTAEHWWLLLFALSDVHYDHRDETLITFVDPDGSYHFVSAT